MSEVTTPVQTINQTFPHTIRKANNPSQTYYLLHFVFAKSTPTNGINNIEQHITTNTPTIPPATTNDLSFPLDAANILNVLTASITQFYGTVGQSTIKFHTISVNPTNATAIIMIDNFAANAFRNAMTTTSQYNNQPLSIHILQQGSTLDQLSLNNLWYEDLLD